jgi:hypothetical protein
MTNCGRGKYVLANAVDKSKIRKRAAGKHIELLGANIEAHIFLALRQAH